MNSKIYRYLRKIRYNYLLLLLNFSPSFPRKFFFLLLCFLFCPNGIFIARHLLANGFVKNTLITVNNIIRIIFTVLIFRVIVKEVILMVLPQIQRREWWQKLNYGGNFLTPFCLFILFAAPSQKCARVSHEIVQFVLKIAHLTISMEPTPLLEKVSSHGLLPRL